MIHLLTRRASDRNATGPHAALARGVCYAALLVIGVYVALLGPALPDLTARAGVPLGDGGAIFTAIFAASIGSTIVAGRALDRHGRRVPLAIALLIHAAALLLLPWLGSWPALLAAAALLGLGDGAIVVCVHILVADLSPGNEAAALNRLNVAFGIGAVLGGALAGVAGALDMRAVLLLLPFGAAQVANAAIILAGPLPGRGTGAGHGAVPSSDGARLWSSRLLWLLAALLLVYVGVEVGLGGWAFTYARQAAGLGATAAALLNSGYWGALTAGRLLSPLALRRAPPHLLLVAAPLCAAAGTLALVVAGDSPPVLVAGVLVAGVGFGPVWPVVFALAARAFPESSGSAGGVLAMVSALGGVVVPWLQGRALAAGGPSAAIAVTFVGCLLVALCAEAVRRRGPGRSFGSTA